MQIWDVYLDVHEARPLLHAAETLERHRWVREPLPFTDIERLLRRLRYVATIAAEDARNWQFEADDRLEEAQVDGGRWGSSETAARMAATAQSLADGSRKVFEAARVAADDLAVRIESRPPLDGGPGDRAG